MAGSRDTHPIVYVWCGWLRRLQRLAAERRNDGRAYLDRVHEEGVLAAAVQRYEDFLPAHGRSGRATRQGHQPACYTHVSGRLRGGVCGWHPAAGNLRSAEWRGRAILALLWRRREGAAAPASGAGGKWPGRPGGQEKEGLFRQDRRHFQG